MVLGFLAGAIGIGGSSDKKTIKENIKDYTNNTMKTKVETVNETLNKSLTEVTTNVVNKAATEIETKTKASAITENIAEGIVIRATGGAKSSVTQDSAAQVKLEAMISIISNNDIKNKTANEIASELVKKVGQDAKANADLMQVARLEKLTKQSEGIANVVNNVVDSVESVVNNTVDNLLGKETEENIEREIEKIVNNTIDTQIKSVVIDENEVYNKIKTTVTNEFNNLSKDECLADAQARNILRNSRIEAEGINELTGERSEAIFAQKASTEAITKCLISKNIGNSAFSDLTTDASFKAMSEALQASDSSGKLEDVKEEKITNITTDAFAELFGDIFKNFALILPIIAGIIGVIVVIIIIFMFMGGGGSDVGMSYDYDNEYVGDEMEGGAIAIFTLQRAIILVAIMGGIDYIIKQFNK